MSTESSTQIVGERGSTETSQEQQKASGQAARLARVRDYQEAALAKEDLLQANLGSAASGLMRIGIRLDEVIEQVLAGGSPTLERALKSLPAIETHLRLMRQVDRFAQLELRGTKGQTPTVTSKLAKPETSPLAPEMPSEDLTR